MRPFTLALALLALSAPALLAEHGHHEKPWGSYPEEWKQEGVDYVAEWKPDYGERWVNVLNTFQGGRPRGNPVQPTRFTLREPMTVKVVQTMHWNGGKGRRPGKIFLLGDDGTMHGPWWTNGLPGPKGQPNVIWQVTPIVELPPGTYRIIDSHPESWSANGASGGAGMALVGALRSEKHRKKKRAAGRKFMSDW